MLYPTLDVMAAGEGDDEGKGGTKPIPSLAVAPSGGAIAYTKGAVAVCTCVHVCVCVCVHVCVRVSLCLRFRLFGVDGIVNEWEDMHMPVTRDLSLSSVTRDLFPSLSSLGVTRKYVREMH